MDYTFVEMRKEYIRSLMMNIPDSQLGYDRESKPPTEVIEKDL